MGSTLLVVAICAGTALMAIGRDHHAVEIDQLISFLRRQCDIEFGFLDVTQVDEDSPERATFAFLEVEGFVDLVAIDLSHFGQDASDRAALELVDRWHSAGAGRGAPQVG